MSEYPKGTCLYCYETLEGEGAYHEKCCRKMFGRKAPPELPYRRDQLNELARHIIRSRVTVPGVQTKLSLDLNRQDHRNRLTLVGLWGHYILKPPVDEYPELPANEAVTMKMASVAGIPTVPNALIPLASGELAYITRRIDRPAGKPDLHMEDFCQLNGRLTEDKYKSSLERAGSVILRHATHAGMDLVTFFELAVFAFLTGNGDMHLKNFSLIREDGGIIRLAPAYDLLSTRLIIPAREDPEETALTLNGKRSRLLPRDFRALGENLGLNPKQIGNTLKKFRRLLPGFRDLVDRSFLSPGMRGAYRDLLDRRAERLFRELEN